MSIQAAHWVFFGVAFTVAGTLTGIWLKHHLDVRKEGLIGVRDENGKLREARKSLQLSVREQAGYIKELQDHKRFLDNTCARQFEDLDRVYDTNARFEARLDENWRTVGLEMGWPPVRRLGT